MFQSCLCKTTVGLANFDQFIRMRNWISYHPEPGPGKEEDTSSDRCSERGADMQIWIVGQLGLSTALSPSHEFWGVEGASSQQIVMQFNLDSQEATGQPVDP